MFANVARSTLGLLIPSLALAASLVPSRTEAIPIFAQRYALTCKTCHTVLPELNAFGNDFRNRGYRLPPSAPRHGTTIAALRYNNEYEREPPPGMRRFTPSSSIVADADIGAVNAFLHYGLGAGGGPGQPFLGFLSYENDHVKQLFRLGLYELPLTHSPSQRLDDISPYGYESTTVGQNDLALNAPRLGLETERTFGKTRLALSIAQGEFKGAAYGGVPIDDGTRTVAGRPEIGIFGRGPIVRNLDFSAEILDGQRSIKLPGRSPVPDEYQRFGYGLQASFFQTRLLADFQQWLGHDTNADGSGGDVLSSGGYARLKYFVTPHLYLAGRYDAQAAPFASRDAVFYVGTFVTPHARIVFQRRNDLLRGTPTYGAEFIIGVPWPVGL